jgi:hypothetical protein
VTRWAENEDFTGGPFEGTPTKREPSSGEVAEGVRPGDQLPARVFNWLLNKIDRAAEDIADAPAISWGRVFTDNADLDIDGLHGKRIVSVRDGTTELPALLCVIDSTAIFRSWDGEQWTAVDTTGYTPSTGMFMMAGRQNGPGAAWITMLVTPADGALYVSGDAGDTWAFLEDLSAYTGLAGGAYYDAIGRFFLGHDSGVLYSGNDGATWLEASGITTTNVVGFVVPEVGEDAAPFILALTIPSAPGGSNPFISTDGGETWTVCATPPGHVSGWSAGAWSPEEKAVYVVSTVGKVFRSTDPLSSWTEVANFGAAASVTMAQIGRCVVACPGDMAQPGIRGNVWVFPAGEDPLPIAVGDPTRSWKLGGVYRHAGGLALVRARETATNVWNFETAFTTVRSGTAARGSL